MSERRFFVLLSVGLGLIVTGVNTSCPLELNPPVSVVKYGEGVTITCSTWWTNHSGIGWEVSVGGTGLQKVSTLPWTVRSLTQWSISPMCFFSSRHSQCTITAELVIYTFPDTISIKASSGPGGEMEEGKEYYLTCDIGDVAPVQNVSVRWYNEDTIVFRHTSEDPAKEPVNLSPVFEITAARENNGRRFRCEANLDLRPYGPEITVSSQELVISVLYGPEIACDRVEIMEGQTLEEECPVVGNPTPTVRWFLDGQPVNSSIPFGRENAGAYRVEAEGFEFLNKTVQFVVLYGPELTCPGTYTALEHSAHDLQCNVTGYPRPKIVWYKDGEEVELNKRLSRRDAGQYVITASNNLTSVNATVEVLVEYPPSEIAELEDTEIDVGSDLWLKCSSVGNPRPEYSWIYYKTENAVEESEDGVSRLVIHNVTAYNRGLYTCLVKNNRGEVRKAVRVTVNGASQECPVKITPDTMVVEYQSKGHRATCQYTDPTNAHWINWRVTEGGQRVLLFNESWFPDTQDGWDTRPACAGHFEGIGTCEKKLKFILFKTPDSVSVRRPVGNSTSVLEDKAFHLECDVVNVAPAQNLSVRWFRGNHSIWLDTMPSADCPPGDGTPCDFKSSQMSPVNMTSTVTVTLNRLQGNGEFRCEAILNLELQSPLVTVSEPLNITVLYKPVIDTTKLPKTVPLFRGYPEELVCEASGSPAPQIQWFYGPDKVVRVSEGRLTVYEEGVYNCSARNDVDSAVHVVEVVLKEDYLPLIAGFVAVTVVVISVIFVFLYSIYYKNTKMRRYSLKNPKLSTHNGNVATNGWDPPLPMTKLS